MKIGVPLIDLDLLGDTGTREGVVPLSTLFEPSSKNLSESEVIPQITTVMGHLLPALSAPALDDLTIVVEKTKSHVHRESELSRRLLGKRCQTNF